MPPKTAKTTNCCNQPTNRQAELLAKKVCEVLGEDLDDDSGQSVGRLRHPERRKTPTGAGSGGDEVSEDDGPTRPAATAPTRLRIRVSTSRIFSHPDSLAVMRSLPPPLPSSSPTLPPKSPPQEEHKEDEPIEVQFRAHNKDNDKVLDGGCTKWLLPSAITFQVFEALFDRVERFWFSQQESQIMRIHLAMYRTIMTAPKVRRYLSQSIYVLLEEDVVQLLTNIVRWIE